MTLPRKPPSVWTWVWGVWTLPARAGVQRRWGRWAQRWPDARSTRQRPLPRVWRSVKTTSESVESMRMPPLPQSLHARWTLNWSRWRQHLSLKIRKSVNPKNNYCDIFHNRSSEPWIWGNIVFFFGSRFSSDCHQLSDLLVVQLLWRSLPLRLCFQNGGHWEEQRALLWLLWSWLLLSPSPNLQWLDCTGCWA